MTDAPEPQLSGMRNRVFLDSRPAPVRAATHATESLITTLTDPQFGFSTKLTGGHMARSMMLPELTALLQALSPEATLAQYRQAILEENVLAKPTQSSRVKSLHHLVELYTLDGRLILFRLLRRLAAQDPESLPLLALVLAFCRDPQLRQSFALIDRLRPGETLPRERMEEHLEQGFPGRFSVAMKKSLAQNVNTSWTVTGHLKGRSVKVKARPSPRPMASVYAAVAGYLSGLRGEMLLGSPFGHLVGVDQPTLASHLAAGAARGLLRYRSAGGVVEIDFTPLLTDAERQVLNGTH